MELASPKAKNTWSFKIIRKISNLRERSMIMKIQLVCITIPTADATASGTAKTNTGFFLGMLLGFFSVQT